MSFRSRHIALALIATLIAIVAVAAGRPDRDREAARLKAEYLYLQASQAETDENFDTYMLMLRRAHRLAPADMEISGTLGRFDLAVGAGDSARTMDAYRMLLNGFLANPSDYILGSQTAVMAAKLNRLDDAAMVWGKLETAFPDRTDPSLNLGKIYLTKYLRGDTASFAPAMEIFDRLERNVGISPQLTHYKVMAHSMRHDTTAMISEIQHMYASAPGNAEIAIFTGQYFDALERPDSALFYFDRAAEIDSLNGAIYLTRADFFKDRGDSVAYDREVFRALTSPTLDFDPKFRLLTNYVKSLYQDTTQQSRIENLFQVLESVNPGEARMHYLYGAYLVEVDDVQRAAEQFGYATELEPADPDYWHSYVGIYMQMEQYDRAAEVACEAMKRIDDNLFFPLAVGAARMLGKRYEQGIEEMKQFDVSEFNNPEGVSEYYGSIADLYYHAGSPDSAFVYYDYALQANPSNAMALNNVAYYMALTPGSDLDQAERYVMMALRSGGETSTALDTYAWILFKKKDYNKAKTYIDRAIGSFGISGTPDKWKDQLGDAEEGAYDDLIEKMSAELLDHAGDIYFINGDSNGAVLFWQEALKLAPDDELIKLKIHNRRLLL